MTTDAQTRIRDSRFVVIGAGGLGGPVAYALAAADAGEIVLIDHDAVELSNLHRQVQFTTDSVGEPKAAALAVELVRRGYPRNRVRAHQARFDLEHAPGMLLDAHVAVDCSDNFETKFAVNDSCVAAGVPFVIGGVMRYSGQVLSVVPTTSGCYRCLFESAPPPEESDNCAQAGVLGPVVAIVAGYMARSALALAAGHANDAGTLLVFDDLSTAPSHRRVPFNARPDCPVCAACANATLVDPLPS